ncbi:MAG TPA: hypothetical protein VD971_10120 [Phycisphaerales bacterium]|nr:hypothetical protein [Phycisphaerales bacterium]
MKTAKTISILALTLLAGAAGAQPCPEVEKLGNFFTPGADEFFGQCVSMSFGGPNNAPLLAVGRPGDDAPVAGVDAGGFVVYQKVNGWSQMYGAWNTTGQGGERLGSSIGLADPYLIAGAPNFSNTGRARLFRRPSNGSGYTSPVDLTPSIGGIGSGFGSAVAVSAYGGGWAVVGAPTHGFHGLVESGAAFFYTRDDATNAWSQVYQIWGGDFGGDSSDRRGTAVAMAQMTEFAAVGSPNHEDAGQPSDHGTVRVVHRLANGFVSGQSVEVSPPSPEQAEHFGAAVAIENDILVVGAPDEDMTLQEGGFMQAATNGGAIYIFKKNGSAWEFQAKLRSPNPTPNAQFGSKVATDGGLQILASEPGTKKVYIYSSDGGTWHYQGTLADADAAAGGNFGSSVAVRNGDMAVGDHLDDHTSVSNPGAVYVTNFENDIAIGDRCGSEAIQVQSGDYVGCTAMATATDLDDPVATCGNGGGGQGNDVWFVFQPACDGNAIFDTFGSEFDTVLSVHTGCPTIFNNGTSITCSDDASFPSPNHRASLVTFNFTANQTYYIRVTGYSGASGQFTLRNLISYGVQNDTCATAHVFGNSFGTAEFNTCAATDSEGLPEGCNNSDMVRDVWFRWIAVASGPVNINTCGSHFDTTVQVFTGNQQNCPNGNSTVIACNDDSTDSCNPGSYSLLSDLTFDAVAGTSYMIRVGGFGFASYGHGVLTIQPGSHCNGIDFNNDSLFPDNQDLVDFLNVFGGGPCSTGDCDDIDFNNDGLYPDNLDIEAFFSVFGGGECLE